MRHFLWEARPTLSHRLEGKGVVVAPDAEAVFAFVREKMDYWESGLNVLVTPMEVPTELGPVWEFTLLPAGESKFKIPPEPWLYQIGDVGPLAYGHVEVTPDDGDPYFVEEGTLVEIADREEIEAEPGNKLRRYTAWILNDDGTRKEDGASCGGLFNGSLKEVLN